MPSEGENFHLSGPTHLINAIDWSNFYHRRSVAASLVRGVYIQEHDRQKNRQGPQALAPPWWNLFNFRKQEVLIDLEDNSIFGAVYEFQNQIYPALNIPKYIIAFRGTLMKRDTVSQDFKLDLECIRDELHHSTRFQVAIQTVQKFVARVGAPNVWLTGHSLGSAIALLAGKNMHKKGYSVETYLFNPPFLSVPIESLFNNEKLKHGARFIRTVLTAGVSTLVAEASQHHVSQEHDTFAVLSHWIPYLFVNPADHICSEYIGYFEHRNKMGEMGAGKIERLATKNTMRSLVSGALGGDSEALHLLPSAYLTIINQGPLPEFMRAHSLNQWWNPQFPSQSTLHLYDHLY